MKRARLFAYVLVLLVGWYFCWQEVSKMNTAIPPRKAVFDLPAETVYLYPLILLLVIHLIIEWMGSTKPEVREHGIPIARIFVDSPESTIEFVNHNPLYWAGGQFLFLVNASRKFKQMHRGQRIIKVIKFSKEEQQKAKSRLDYEYVYDDALSQEELVNYIYTDGHIEIQGFDYRVWLRNYAKLFNVGHIEIVEMKGIPNNLEELAIGLTTAGYSERANELLESRNIGQNKEMGGLKR